MDAKESNIRRAAAAQARGDPDEPRTPTRTERLQAQVDALSIELDELRLTVDRQNGELEFHRGNLSELDHERHQAYTSLQAELATARSQINHWMVQYNDEKRSRAYWEKWAKAHGWTREEIAS